MTLGRVPTAELALVHVLELEPSPLTDHAFGTVFPHMSVGLICPWTPFNRNGKRI